MVKKVIDKPYKEEDAEGIVNFIEKRDMNIKME